MELLAPNELDEALKTLSWRVEGDALVKVTKHADFAAALAYVNEVARLAEEAGHHPDIDIRWATVTLRQWTHTLGGVTAADVALARSIDLLDN